MFRFFNNLPPPCSVISFNLTKGIFFLKKILFKVKDAFYEKKESTQYSSPKIETNEKVEKSLPDGNRVIYFESDSAFLDINVQGSNNLVEIGKLLPGITGKISINLYGEDCSVVLSDRLWVSQYLTICVGQNHPNFGKVRNVKVELGSDVSIEGCVIITYNSNTKVSLGSRCMLSFGITIYNTDGHPILDKRTNKIINKVRDVVIEEHCWLGANSTILKNVHIPQDSIVGWGAVVTSGSLKQFGTKNDSPLQNSGVILSGNPARICKTEITWSQNGSAGYVDNVN